MGRTAYAFRFLTLLAISFCIHAVAQKVPTEKFPSIPLQPGAPSPTSQIERLVTAVSGSVVSIDSTGDRTVENIADYSVTLGIGKMQDDTAFRVLCINGGKSLLSFVQSLVEGLDIQGKVSKPACTGTDNASDSLALQLHLHREGGNSLFQEAPLLLTPTLEKPDDDTPASDGPEPGNEVATDDQMEALRTRVAAESTEPLTLNPVHTQTSHASMSFPKGWSPEELPKPIHSDSPFATFDLSMTFEDGKLVTDQKLVIKKDKVEATERAAFDKWRQDSEIGQDGTSIQVQSTIYFPNIAFSGKTDAEKKAAELIREASDAIQKRISLRRESFSNSPRPSTPATRCCTMSKPILLKLRATMTRQ